jgi:hypothetical protein
MPKKQFAVKVMRLKASPAAFVYAPDEKSALKKAIEEFEIRREDQKRLLVLRSR